MDCFLIGKTGSLRVDGPRRRVRNRRVWFLRKKKCQFTLPNDPAAFSWDNKQVFASLHFFDSKPPSSYCPKRNAQQTWRKNSEIYQNFWQSQESMNFGTVSFHDFTFNFTKEVTLNGIKIVGSHKRVWILELLFPWFYALILISEGFNPEARSTRASKQKKALFF